MIRLADLSIRLGSFELRDVSLEVPQGAYAVLMGRSGTGKTSLLETICGLRQPRSGKIFVGEQEVTDWTPAARGIGYVPQDGAIFTTMTVRDQIGFGLELRRVSRREINERVDELAGLLRIEHLLRRKPRGLSGGERQRVALGRALAFYPKLLCLDEPTSALDDLTRDEIHDVIRKVREHSQATVLHVSHSMVEAEALGDMIFQIEAGKIQTQELTGSEPK